ncbi:hypothetical protein FEV53_16350 [Palleronia caenipelagi]|uniref:Type I restriction modification DNA specificity domain-containing protein n=1 Tax=Palleronia caenipelagi TaxID=2489174 RepID=A0A547PMR5_9RHOB|nr:hypothetical protein FEV53_16350 [Palleronia caenipelagi]
MFFLALNSEIVQRQIRSTQFTADIIDTIGRRYRQIAIPTLKDANKADELRQKVRRALETRVRGKAFIKQAPVLIEQTLKDGHTGALDAFLKLEDEELEKALVSDTVTLEFGGFEATSVPKSKIKNRIYLPKYYDPEINEELQKLSGHCEMISIGEAVNDELIELQTGHEPGKLAYGTGEIPFLRTSDFANWELKHNPKQAVSQEIYDEYNGRQDLRPYDILLVRDGTYLVGSSTIVQEGDEKALYCGGLYRIRSMKNERLPPYLLLGLLNSYVVKRQIRSKQFTRDVIDTIGKRLTEVQLPIPRDLSLRAEIAEKVKTIVEQRSNARNELRDLAAKFG